MKLLKNIVRLSFLISLSLSITPLTTAKAADAIQVQTEDTTDTGTTTTDAGTPAYSDVSVTVLSGILTLEAVPDFNFGTMMQGTTAKLKSNTANVDGFSNAVDDGNSTGLLEIIDSRNFSSTMAGFTLSASIGQLESSDGSETLPAILKLSSLPLLNSDNQNISNSSADLKTQAITTKSVDGDTPATSDTLINLEKGSYNAGMIKANFNTPDSASLTIPGTSNTTTKSAKNMNAVVTWTLTAKPTVTN